MPEPRPALAIDLGGTKILAALVRPDGRLAAEEYELTDAWEGKDAVVARICNIARRTLNAAGLEPGELAGAAIAAAGIIDTNLGLVTVSPHLPGWSDVPLGEILHERLNIPAWLVNDASAAALGEQRFGAGKGMKNLLYITVSTGIGGGIILDGQLYEGTNGAAGEFGHMTVDPAGPRCPCGNIGCWEVMVSGSAIAAEAARRLGSGESSLLQSMIRGKPESVNAQMVGEAADRGDGLAREIIARAAEYLGIGLVNLVNIFNPQMIVIGGGVSNLGEMILQPARQLVWERAFKLPGQTVRIVKAGLGQASGVLGAAALVFRKTGEDLA
jgi:glucokinase